MNNEEAYGWGNKVLRWQNTWVVSYVCRDARYEVLDDKKGALFSCS